MKKQKNDWKYIKSRLHTIIFEADTPKGKLFDADLYNT